MPRLTVDFESFALTSRWTATEMDGWTKYSTPTKPTKTLIADLSSILAGSTITAAVFSGSTNGFGDSHAKARDITKNITNAFSVDVLGWLEGRTSFSAINIVCDFQAYGGTGNGSASGTTYSRSCSFSGVKLIVDYTLPTSSGTLDKASLNAGETVVLTVTPNEAGVSHRVEWAFGDHSETHTLSAWDGESALTDAITIPLAWLSAIPNAVSGQASVTLTTIKSGVETGSIDLPFTVGAPAAVVPVAGTLSDTRIDGDVPAAWGLYVQGRSKAALALSGYAGVYGAGIAYVRISGAGYSAQTDALTTDYLRLSGDVTFTGVVTDTRGRSASATCLIHIEPYSAPNFSALDVIRADADGAESELGAYLRVLGAFYCSSVNDHNSVACGVQYRLGEDGMLSASQAVTSGEALVIGGSISQTSAYQVLLTLTDAICSVTCIVPIPTALFAINCLPQSKGVAFGEAATVENAVVVKSDWSLIVGGQNLLDRLSAMQTAIDARARKFDATLVIGTAWTGSAAPYTQVVSVSGVLATDNPVAGLVHGSDTTAWDAEDAAWSAVRDIVTADGSVTVYAGSVTTTAITVRLKEVRG